MTTHPLVLSLSSLALSTVVAPVFTTSCSSETSTVNLSIELQTSPIIAVEDTKTFKLQVKFDSNLVALSELQVESKSKDLLTVDSETVDTNNCTFNAKGIKAGKAQIEVSATDGYGNTNNITFDIEVKDVEGDLIITTGEVPTSIFRGGISEFDVSAKYAGKSTTIKECKVDSTNEQILRGTYNNGKVNLITCGDIGKVSITLEITDIKNHYNKLKFDEIDVFSYTTITYGRDEYIVLDEDEQPNLNVNPNMFCTYNEDDTFKPISFKALKNNSDITMFSINTEDDLNKLSGILIGNCDPTITTIENSFLDSCEGLSVVDLSGLINITKICGWFLYMSTSLKLLSLSGLDNVTTVGDSFFEQSGIYAIDLYPLRNLTSMGQNFMRKCRSLTEIDLSPLSNVEIINFRLFGYCDSLKHLDFRPFKNIKTVGQNFLATCSSLEYIILFNKSPKDFKTSTSAFLLYVPKTCILYTKEEFMDAYKTTSPWDTRIDQYQVKNNNVSDPIDLDD